MGNATNTRKKRISVDHVEGTRDFLNRDAIPVTLREGNDLAVSAEDISNIYIFSKLIGKGQFGKTKEAYLIRNPAQRFAIKCIKTNKTTKQLNQFASELTLLKSLNHPNIVKLHETYKSDSHLYLVTEMCKGGDLQTRIEHQTRFPEKQVARIMFQCFYAVKYMHKLGVAHRDLKPDNILFSTSSPDSEVKIADFGLSKYFAENLMGQMRSRVGSDAFAAPEVWTNNYDEQCDNWSMGVIMYMMLSGSFPFKNETTKGMLEEIKLAKFSTKGYLFRGVSAEAKDLINQLLVADPTKRYTATEALEHPFFNFNRFTEIEVDQKLVTRVLKASKMQKLKFEILNIVVKTLPEAEEENYKAHFRYFDKSNNGFIDTEDFLTRLRDLGNEISYLQTKPLIEKLNLGDYRKTVSYNEFIIAAYEKELITKNKAHEIFGFFDVDRTGLLDAEKLKQGFAKTGTFYENSHLSHLIEECKPKIAGLLSFAEFFNLIRNEC